ncbi:MAG TPA: outer membrane beta-barrel protein, partial [Roseiarcus sp.]|nr:outer membrane beta-barrel protein [Roseiarcus sp.]
PTRGSLFEATDVGLGVQSIWSRNDLHASLHGGYTDYFSVPAANTPNASGTLGGRIDASKDLTFDGEGRFTLAAQTPGSLTLPTGIVLASNQRPLYETYDATLGGEQKFGDWGFALHGTFDRTVFQNATLGNGVIDDLASDDSNDWGLRGRISYRMSEAVSPFVESVVDTRRYDSVIDSSGFARDSVGALGRAGATLSFSELLSGELSGGYGERHYRDARLPDLKGPLVDASLIWSVTPLTKVTLKTTSALNDTVIAGASGALTRIYSVDISHAFLRNLTFSATGSYETDNYVGIPQTATTTNLALRADYNVTRDIMLRASVARTDYQTNIPGQNYRADVVMLGLKLQR